MGKLNQILFISHKSNRGGASILLLEIIREFKRQSSLPIQIILLENGPLAAEFETLAPTFHWFPKPVGKTNIPLQRFLRRILSVLNVIRIMFRVRNATVVFSNTITNGHIHYKLLFLKAKWITYVHELEISIHAMTNRKTLDAVLRHTDYFLAGSVAVQNNLTKNHAVPPMQVEVIYSSIPVLHREKTLYAEFVNELRNKFRIPPDALVFGVAAENEWRKGFDLFSPLIRLYIDTYPESNAHFIWMGIRTERMNYFDDMVDFQKYAITDRTHFIPHGSEYLKHLALFDVHLLLSREDPFPLVVLDAASFSIPTICFQKAGGAPEFVDTDAGICVPYGNLAAVAAAMNKMGNDPVQRSAWGNHAREKLKAGYSQSDATERIIKRINQFL